MGRKHWLAGWTRIGQVEFKAAIAAALRTEPDLCERLRAAIKASAARGGVRREVRDEYLLWIGEVEAAAAAMAEAEHRKVGSSPAIPPILSRTSRRILL
jgi:hypothetical protein